MLTNIQQLYFFKTLFSYINEGLKLKIVAHNKNLQGKLDINLINYKTFSGKYFLGEKNGIGKIYDGKTDKLLFEGNFLNGKKNGKGKEYNVEEKLIYEGEYLNGLKHGKGKEYNKKGECIFEGEYINGIKWNGEFYGFEYCLVCEIKEGKGSFNKFTILRDNIMMPKGGEIINGELNGKFEQHEILVSTSFEGEYINGKRNGKGKEFYDKGKLGFEGE